MVHSILIGGRERQLLQGCEHAKSLQVLCFSCAIHHVNVQDVRCRFNLAQNDESSGTTPGATLAEAKSRSSVPADQTASAMMKTAEFVHSHKTRKLVCMNLHRAMGICEGQDLMHSLEGV